MFVNIRKNDSVELVVDRAMGWRVTMFVLVVVVTAFFSILMARIPGPTAPQGTASPPSINVMWLIVIAIDALILWYASPHELRCNLRRGTYSAKRGFLFVARPVSGTFQDFYGLCLRPNKNKYGWTVSYRIDLDWNDKRHSPFELASFVGLEKAQRVQQELAAKLGNLPTGSEI